MLRDMNRPLRIALDIRQLTGGASGDRSYLLGLLGGLLQERGGQELLLCHAPGPSGLETVPEGASLREVSAQPGWLWTPVVWPLALRLMKADVAHAQYLIPPLAPCPTVVTIHDVSFLAHPEWFPAKSLRVMRRLIPLSARRATRVVTGSEHAAGEIARLCGVRRERIAVIPYAADERFRPRDRDTCRAQVKERYGLDAPYLLAVGLLQPRKNLPRLLDAFSQVAAQVPGLTLAVVGRAGWGAQAVQERIARPDLAGKVKLLGAAPDDDLPLLYGAALALCYPSLYEGFGLPPLEAMACGTPVVASGTTSVPEVVGDAGVLVDPQNVESIADGMVRVVEDDTLREELSRRGLERAQAFSWTQCAQTHLALYRELVGS